MNNKKDLIRLVVIIAMFIVIGMQTACTVSAKEIRRGETFCEQYGGIDEVNSLHKVASCKTGHATTITAYND